MSESIPAPELDKTDIKRSELHRDRWSSFESQGGIVEIADRLDAAALKEFEIFEGYDDRFLEKVSHDVSLVTWEEGSVLFEQGTYIDLAFFVVSGEVEVWIEGGEDEYGGTRPIFDHTRTVIQQAEEQSAAPIDATTYLRTGTRVSDHEITLLATMDFDLPRHSAARLGAGEVFGEIGALSGWPQSVTARTKAVTQLIQIRMPALRLMKRKSKELKERLDRLYRDRSLTVQLKNTPVFRLCTQMFLDALAESVELVSLEPSEVLVREGEPANDLYVVRSGFVKLVQSFEDGELAVSYLSKGMTLGDVELLVPEVDNWQVTAESVEYSELVRVPGKIFDQMLKSNPALAEVLWGAATERIRETGAARRHVPHSEFIEVALENGLVQGNSILAIDLNQCTRCDDCVKACADTHGGRPRFVREGNRYQNLLIAKSCYHCRDPVCLVGCPTGAIHRAGASDVVTIEEEICIGCSTCYRNCPYDAIVMWDTEETWPDDMVPSGLRGKDRRAASKCDLCFDTGHEPACVENCPQGCAFRIGSVNQFRQLLQQS